MRVAWGVFTACFGTACVPDLQINPALEVLCTEDRQCLEPQVCQRSKGVCVDAAALDAEAPWLANATAGSANTVRLTFSEVMGEGMVDPARYTIDPPLAIVAVTLELDGQSVTLVTSRQLGGETYTVRAVDLVDVAGNALEVERAGTSFSGFGVRDPTVPDIDAPREALFVNPAQVTLRWSLREGASAYIVQVSVDPTFETGVIEKSTEQESLTLLGEEVQEPVTYFWRVRANITDMPFSASYPSARFDVLRDAVFVSCGSTESCEKSDDEIGSRTRPYRRVQDGIAAATVRRVPGVWVAARGDGQPYREEVHVPSGIMLRGGYDKSFAAYDPVAFETVLESDAEAVVSASNAVGFVIEGFTIRGAGTLRDLAFGIYFANVNDVTVRDCKIEPRPAIVVSTALRVIDGGWTTPAGSAPSILIEGNQLVAGTATSEHLSHSYGLDAARSKVRLHDNIIRSDDALRAVGSTWGSFDSVALKTNEVELEADANTISSSCSSFCAAWAVFASNGRSFKLTNNVIVVGAGGQNGGIFVSQTPTLSHLVNNTFYIDTSPATTWGIDQDNGALVAVNNLWVSTAPTLASTRHAAIQDNGMLTCQNNVFVDYACAYDRYVYGGANCQAAGGTRCTTPNGNLGLSAASAALPGFATGDYAPSASAHASIRQLGRDTTMYGVTTDREGRTRTCPSSSACYSVGAHEVD